MRRLSLHASALNDEEYELYTASIIDFALSDAEPSEQTGARNDAFYEGLNVSVREVRAWLRGRYTEIGGIIETILKLFSPGLSQADTLSGGEFFAALRLVVHAQNGKEVDRALAFVQASPKLIATTYSGQQARVHPSQTTHSTNNPFIRHNKSLSSRSEGGSSSIPPLPPRKPAPPPPSGSSSSSTMKLSPSPTPIISSPPSTSTHPTPPPLKPKPSIHRTSTLIKQSLQANKTAQTMKKAEEQLEKERVLQVLRSSAIVSGPHFLAGSAITHSSVAIGNTLRASGSRSPTKRIPVPKSDSSASYSGSEGRDRPPLPKRRPQPPPRQQQPSPPMSTSSLEQVALAVVQPSTTNPRTPYTSSPFDSPENSPRRRPSELPDLAGLPPPTHPGRKSYSGITYQMPSSVPVPDEFPPLGRNLETFEAIYGTGSSTNLTAHSTTNTPTMPTLDSTPTSSVTPSPSTRVYRSKSLHHHSHPPPPPPPTRRKRPESVQVLSNGEVLFGTSKTNSVIDSVTTLNGKMDLVSNNKGKGALRMDTPLRRSSLSASFGTSAFALPSTSTDHGGGVETLHKALAGLQLKAENALPKLEAARFKAEAGLSRRGFIPERKSRSTRSRSRHGNDTEGLMSERYNEGDNDDLAGGGDEGANRDYDDRDELKWPAGDGWKML